MPASIGGPRLAAIAASALLLAGATRVLAIPGVLDPSFGSAGVATHNIQAGDLGNAVAVQADDKVVVVGVANNVAGFFQDIGIVRWNADGSIDSGFGTGGSVRQHVTESDAASAVAIQPDGKIVVVGYRDGQNTQAPTGCDIVVMRLNTDGTLDASFGSGGIVTTDVGGIDFATDVIVQPDGKLLVAGITQGIGYGMVVVRYLSTGALDAGFGTAGKATYSPLKQTNRMLLQPDGKIVVGGALNASCSPCGDFGLVRLLATGALDAGFGSGGTVAVDLSGPDRVQALALQPDGAIVAVGGSGFSFNAYAARTGVLRVLSDGTPDATFGSGGKVTIEVSPSFDEAFGVRVEADGALTVSGHAALAGGNGMLLRLTSSGATDTTFGSGGTTVFAASTARTLSTQADGRLIVAGTSGGGDLAAWRFYNNDCADSALQPGEQCDDGNLSNGDCCSSLCLFEPAATVCRAASDLCDQVEQCTGGSGTCPADTLQPLGTPCRAAAGECDIAEACDGSSAACPTDAFVSAATPCTSDGNACTVDACDGAQAACQHPAGNAGTLCRAAAGICDLDETCTGASPSCPGDALLPNGTACADDGNPCTSDACDGVAPACQHPAGNAGALCRAAADQCDLAELCTGASPSCPTDAPQPDGTGCDDGDACTSGDACAAGACGAGPPTVCDFCEVCDSVGGCLEEPRTGCRLPTQAEKSSLAIKFKTPSTKSSIAWKWSRGQATTLAELGNPLVDEDYGLCVYAGAGETLVFRATAPAGGTCGTLPCWALLGTSGFKYGDKGGTSDGVQKLVVKSGLEGKAKAQVKGKGANLVATVPGLPNPPLAAPVRVQLQSRGGLCFESSFSQFLLNDPGRFKAKAD